MTAGVMIAEVSCAAMVRFGYQTVIAASLASLLVSAAAVLFVRPAKSAASTREAHYLTHLKDGVREAVRNRVVLRLIVFGSATAHRFERFPNRALFGIFLMSGFLLLIAAYLMRGR